MRRYCLSLLLVLVIGAFSQPAQAQQKALGAKQLAENVLQAYQQGKINQVMQLLEPATRRFLHQQQKNPLIEELDRLRILGEGEWSFKIYTASQIIDFKTSRTGVKIQGRKGRWLFYPTYPTNVIHYTNKEQQHVRVFIRERGQGWYVMLPMQESKLSETN